jgi:hypothetical protein
MDRHRVWKPIKGMGRRAGVPELHPHAFRHACGVELLKRNGGNVRVVQEHLRHQDIGTTVTYTWLAQHDLQKAVAVFDPGHGNNGPAPAGTEKQRGYRAESLAGVHDGILTCRIRHAFPSQVVRVHRR